MMMAVDLRDHFLKGNHCFLNWVCSGCGYLKRKETELDDGWEGQIRKTMLSYISKGSNNDFQGFLRETIGLKGNHIFAVFVQLMGKNGDVQHPILGLGYRQLTPGCQRKSLRCVCSIFSPIFGCRFSHGDESTPMRLPYWGITIH